MPMGSGGVDWSPSAERFRPRPRRSRHHFSASRLAGGDQDGDLNMLRWNPDLLRILEATEEAVRSVSVEAVDHEVAGGDSHS